jgi:hypothetical protein
MDFPFKIDKIFVYPYLNKGYIKFTQNLTREDAKIAFQSKICY